MTNITSELKNLNTGRILDVATGNGGFLKYLIDTVADYSEAIGIDLKDSAASPFAESFQNNLKCSFLVMPAEKMDFPDASFDTVCISNSLHHLEEPELVLKEMLRVLKPGGTFIISEMYCDGEQTPAQQTHTLLHHWWAAIDRSQNVVHNNTYTRQELVNFALNLGLNQLETEDQCDTSSDPMDPEITEELSPIIERYIERAGDNEDLKKQGEQLRERLQSIGFQGASSLLIMARKD